MLFEGPYSVDWTYRGTQYTVTLEIREVLGRFEPVGISVQPKTRGQEIRPLPPLRAVPVATLFTEALTTMQGLISSSLEDQPPVDNDAELDDTFREKRAAFWADAKRRALQTQEVIKATGEGNGRRWGPDHYKDVLEACAFAESNDLPKNQVVAEFFGLTPDTATKHITRARKQAQQDGAKKASSTSKKGRGK